MSFLHKKETNFYGFSTCLYDKEIIIPRKLPPKIIDLTVLLSKPICRLQPWVILKELHLKLSKIMKFLYYFLKLIN